MEGTYKARVQRVVDGDTLCVVFRFRGRYNTFTMRLWGVNTPEMRGEREREKRVATRIKTWLDPLVGSTVTVIVHKKPDKYGRLLGHVRLSGNRDLADLLVQHHLGKPYYGQGPKGFTRAELGAAECGLVCPLEVRPRRCFGMM